MLILTLSGSMYVSMKRRDSAVENFDTSLFNLFIIGALLSFFAIILFVNSPLIKKSKSIPAWQFTLFFVIIALTTYIAQAVCLLMKKRQLFMGIYVFGVVLLMYICYSHAITNGAMGIDLNAETLGWIVVVVVNLYSVLVFFIDRKYFSEEERAKNVHETKIFHWLFAFLCFASTMVSNERDLIFGIWSLFFGIAFLVYEGFIAPERKISLKGLTMIGFSIIFIVFFLNVDAIISAILYFIGAIIIILGVGAYLHQNWDSLGRRGNENNNNTTNGDANNTNVINANVNSNDVNQNQQFHD